MAQPQGQDAPPPAKSYDTVFTNAKAGMEGVDAELVKRVVYETSKGTPHFENEQRKEQAHEQRIERLQAAAAAMSDADLAHHTASMDAKLAALEAGRDLTRSWLHVDMDAFYAAVEELHNPALANRPFAVGGMSMISTANYAARKFGVRSAMPGFIAVKLCPDLLFVSHDFEKYRAASEQTRAIFREYDPAMRTASLDEASLDVTEQCQERGLSGAQLAAEIRGRVKAETGLTCSVGIAPNRMLAKICSDRNKPNGQYEVEARRDEVMAFMRELGIRKVPGVGKVTQKVLAAFDIHTCAHLLERRGLLEALFGAASCDFFAHVALGLGPTRHEPEPGEGEVGRRGISHERTFRPLSARADLEARLRELAAALAEDMAGEGLRGRTLTLKLKLTSFQLRTRARTLPRHISGAEELYAAAHPLLLAELPCQLRLLGLRVSNFLEAPRRQAGQLSLEQALARGAQQQQQQQQGERQQGGLNCSAGDGPRAKAAGGESDDGGDDGEAVHGSQLLGEGELLELSLRDWQPQGSAEDGATLELSLRDWRQQQQQGRSQTAAAEGGLEAQPADYSLPPSLAVSPATAARFEQEAAGGAAAGDGEGAPAAGVLPLLGVPAIQLGPMLQQVVGTPQAHAAADAQPGTCSTDQQGVAAHHAQRQQAGWACSACTFDNPRAAFWCEACGSSRLGAKRDPTAAGSSSGTPAPGGGSVAKARGGSKGKRGKRAVASAAPSITRFALASQRQPSPPAQQEHHAAGSGAQQEAAAADPASPAGVQQRPPAGEEGQEPAGAPESPLRAGEDIMECRECGEWVRETRLEAHEAMHEDEHLARRLQREADTLDRLLARASQPAAGGAKRASAGKAGGRQGTLTAFAKRPRQ